MIERLLVLAVVMSSLVRPSQAQADLTSEVRPYEGVPLYMLILCFRATPSKLADLLPG